MKKKGLVVAIILAIVLCICSFFVIRDYKRYENVEKPEITEEQMQEMQDLVTSEEATRMK